MGWSSSLPITCKLQRLWRLKIEVRNQLIFPNPLSCVSLLTGPSNLRTMVIVAVMQCMPEGKNISDMLQIYSSENVGMVPVERANFVTAFGMCMMFYGPLVKRTIGMFGNRGHTTFSNAMTIASFIMYGIGQKLLQHVVRITAAIANHGTKSSN